MIAIFEEPEQRSEEEREKKKKIKVFFTPYLAKKIMGHQFLLISYFKAKWHRRQASNKLNSFF